VTEF
jgi:kinesin family protein 18/19